MPFYQETTIDGEIVYNRDRTGPPKPKANTGTTTAEDGSVVSFSTTVKILPATPINVDLPNPNEPLVGKDGRINHHWWRFLNQLYLRTGGSEDNINRVPTTLIGSGTVDSLNIASAAPTVGMNWVVSPTIDSLATASNAPTVS